MPDTDATEDAPPPRGPFFSTWGPLDGPILSQRGMPALVVYGHPRALWSIGIAYPLGPVERPTGRVMTFRLVIGHTQLDGPWICVGREFVQLGEAAEEL